MTDNGFSTSGFSYVEKRRELPKKRGRFSLLSAVFKKAGASSGEGEAVRDLVFRAAVCAVAVLTLFAVKAGSAPEQTTEYSAYVPAEEVAAATEPQETQETEEQQIEDIGRLRFVEAEESELIMPVSGSVASLYDGKENLGVTFITEAGGEVVSVTDGLICEVTALQLKVGMEDGTVLFYQGITPTAQIGDYVKAGDILGYSTAGELTVGAIVEGAAVDPLSILQK